MTFLISFSKLLRRIMGLKDLGESYDSLLGLGMIIVDEVLKCKDQNPNSRQVSAILLIFSRHALSLTILLRWYYDSLFGPGVDEFLHLAMDLMNSSSENGGQLADHLSGISSKISMLTCQFWAMLKVKCRACQRLLISRQGQLLYLTALTAGSLHFLTQFMSFHSPPFLFEISWIFWSKNNYFVLLTVFLNCFQSSNLLVDLYFSRSLLQFRFH